VEFTNGAIVHALVAAIHDLLKDYVVRVGQLETLFLKGELSLQALWCYIEPAEETLRVLDEIVRGIEGNGVRGGELLNAIHERSLLCAGLVFFFFFGGFFFFCYCF